MQHLKDWNEDVLDVAYIMCTHEEMLKALQTTILTEAVFNKCMLVRIDQVKLLAFNRHPDGIKTLAERDFCMFAALFFLIPLKIVEV